MTKHEHGHPHDVRKASPKELSKPKAKDEPTTATSPATTSTGRPFRAARKGVDYVKLYRLANSPDDPDDSGSDPDFEETSSSETDSDSGSEGTDSDDGA